MVMVDGPATVGMGGIGDQMAGVDDQGFRQRGRGDDEQQKGEEAAEHRAILGLGRRDTCDRKKGPDKRKARRA